MKRDQRFKHFSLTLLWLWLFCFALLPFCLIVAISFMGHNENQFIAPTFTFNNYQQLNHATYLHIFGKSFFIAGCSTLICLIVAYPFSYIVARWQNRFKQTLILLVIIPFWTSSLIRSYALIAIIKAKGVLSSLLMTAGLIHQPLSILFTNTAVMIGLIYNLLPFMMLPLITNIERLDQRLIDASRDLGANRWVTFTKVIIPLTLPGIIAGSILVFLPAMTIFYIPDILGGAKSIMLGNLIQNQFLIAENWPMGSTVSTMLTLILAALILIYIWTTRGNKKRDWM